MKYLFLWLEGSLQSWGVDSRFDFRQTLDFPTQSGIYGLLLAASGDFGPQEELLAQMADVPMVVTTFNSSIPKLNDFHMLGSGYDESDPWQIMHIPRKQPKNSKEVENRKMRFLKKQGPDTSQMRTSAGGGAKRTYREYLQDRCFAVILGLPDDLADKFAAALQNPVADLYLGRKCCVPSEMIFQGMFESEEAASAALDNLIVQKNERQQNKRFQLEKQYIYRTVRPGEEPPDDALLLNDVPVRFGNNRLYRDRWVSVEFC